MSEPDSAKIALVKKFKLMQTLSRFVPPAAKHQLDTLALMYSPPRPLHLRIAFAQLADLITQVAFWLAFLLLAFS